MKNGSFQKVLQKIKCLAGWLKYDGLKYQNTLEGWISDLQTFYIFIILSHFIFCIFYKSNAVVYNFSPHLKF